MTAGVCGTKFKYKLSTNQNTYLVKKSWLTRERRL